MKQKPIKSLTAALVATGKAETAATQIGEAVGLKHNTATAIAADRTALVGAINNAEEGKLALGVQLTALYAIIRVVIGFVTMTRDVLKAQLGINYSSLWDAPGFVGSLVIPRTADRLRILLEKLVAYLTAHETYQNAQMNVTAARAQELLNELKAAMTAVANQKLAVKNLEAQRRSKFDAARKRIGDLFKELATLLTPQDMRWVTFGFNRPGALQMPEVPVDILAVLIGTNAVALKWTNAARAEHYRVWKRVVGVDEELVPVGSPADLDFTIEGLPANATIEIAVSAVNDGGESAKSEVVTVQTT